MGFLFVLKRIAWFVVDNWKVVLGVVAAIVVIVVLNRSCRHEPKLDEKQIQKVQDAIAKQDREEMERVLAEVEVIEKQIDANTVDAQAQTHAAIKNAKDKAAGMSNDELAAELEKRLNQ